MTAGLPAAFAGAALAAVASLFAFGAAMIALFASRRPGAAEYWRYYASEFVLVAAVLVPAAVHRAAFLAVLAAAAARCAWEVAVVYRCRGRTAAGAFAALVPLAGSASLALIALREDAFGWIFLLFLVVEAQDAMAWLFGRLFGRRPLLPSLSPRKTIEGAIAGMISAVVLGTPVAVLGLGLAPAPSLALCALLAAAGFAGDVLASLAKRAAGVKDFPPVHALHGGLLDVYDALLFAAIPLAALLSATILP